MIHNISYHLALILCSFFLNSCISAAVFNNSIFPYKYGSDLNQDKCIKFNVSFDSNNKYHDRIFEKDIDQTFTFYKYIKQGILEEFNSYNSKSCNTLSINDVMVKVKFRDRDETFYSGVNTGNVILSSLTLHIIPMYIDLSYEVEYSSKSYTSKSTHDFLLVLSMYNIFLFFRYEKPFHDSFMRITREYIIGYEKFAQ